MTTTTTSVYRTAAGKVKLRGDRKSDLGRVEFHVFDEHPYWGHDSNGDVRVKAKTEPEAIKTLYALHTAHSAKAARVKRAVLRRKGPKHIVPARDGFPAIDLERARRKLCRLPVWRSKLWRKGHGPRCSATYSIVTHSTSVSGRAWWRQERVHLSIGLDATPAKALEVLIHELAHLACPKQHHNKVFRRTLVTAVEQAFGLDCWGVVDIRQVYDIDKHVVGRMTPAIVQKWVV